MNYEGRRNYPPAKLNEKHQLVAMLVASGATNVEIANALDYTVARVAAIRDSPLLKALVEQHLKEMRGRTVGAVIDRIIAEGPASVDAIVTLRDGAANEQTRLAAARDLLDRNPDTAKVSREDRREEVRILFDTRALQRIAAVLEEDVPPLALADATEADFTDAAAPQAPAFQSLDDAVAELARAEAAVAQP